MPKLKKNIIKQKRIKSSSISLTWRIHNGIRKEINSECNWKVCEEKLTNKQCFKSFVGEFSAFLIDKECVKNVYQLISNIILSFKGNTEKFYPAFYKCISDAENTFGEGLKKNALLLL